MTTRVNYKDALVATEHLGWPKGCVADAIRTHVAEQDREIAALQWKYDELGRWADADIGKLKAELAALRKKISEAVRQLDEQGAQQAAALVERVCGVSELEQKEAEPTEVRSNEEREVLPFCEKCKTMDSKWCRCLDKEADEH